MGRDMNDYERLLELARRDFGVYFQLIFSLLEPQTALNWNWHHDYLVGVLDAFRRGELRRINLNMPVRHLKSQIVSIALVTYWLGVDPTRRFMCISYGQDLSDAFSAQRRTVMNSQLYRDLFPGTRLTRGQQSLGYMTTTAGGAISSTSVGGAITGFGADVIVIDDALKPEEAHSIAQRTRVNSWLTSTALSRLNSQETGQVILVMQRLHPEDLSGLLIETGGYTHIKLAAIAEADETYVIDTPYGRRTHLRRQGEALHPSHLSLKRLMEIRKEFGPYVFAAQFQQNPVPLEGAMINIDWFVQVPVGDWPPKFDFVFQSWDCANSIKDGSSYSVCITFGVVGKKLYTSHVFRKRLEYPELRKAILSQAAAHQPGTILIEAKAAGIPLVQDLSRGELSQVKGIEPEGDKRDRMLAHTISIENGLVHIPSEAYWKSDFLDELARFPTGGPDDQVDALSQGLNWFIENGIEPAIISYYKERLRKHREQGAHSHRRTTKHYPKKSCLPNKCYPAASFGEGPGFLDDLRRAPGSVSLVVGSADEVFFADQYAPLLKPVRPDLDVTAMPGLGHMDMIVKPIAVQMLAEKALAN